MQEFAVTKGGPVIAQSGKFQDVCSFINKFSSFLPYKESIM